MITEKPIAQQAQLILQESIQAMFADSDSYVEAEDAKTMSASLEALYEVKKGNDNIGLCLKMAPNGFGGKISLLVGIDLDGRSWA
jgi:Na+-translocating ferredoxin:NAD+ oxidoreductase RnfG subunit